MSATTAGELARLRKKVDDLAKTIGDMAEDKSETDRRQEAIIASLQDRILDSEAGTGQDKLQVNIEKLQDDKQKLQVDKQNLQADNQKLQDDNRKLQDDNQKLTAELETMGVSLAHL